MSGDLWPELEAQLDELNGRALRDLDRMHPEPPGLPPRGSWIRAVQVDDDGHPKPLTPWHYVVGWDAPIGCVSVRCRRYPRGVLSQALEYYLGDRPTWPRRARPIRLLVEASPAEARCRQCEIGLNRDAQAIVDAENNAKRDAILALLPVLEAIARDGTIDDAERGRRLRDLWPRVPADPSAPANVVDLFAWLQASIDRQPTA